jgi:hypothetical protein
LAMALTDKRKKGSNARQALSFRGQVLNKEGSLRG